MSDDAAPLDIESIDWWCDLADTGHEMAGRVLLYEVWHHLEACRRLAYELAHGNRPQLFEGRLHWYSPDENGHPHFLNAALTDAEIAEWEAIQEMGT